MILMIMGKLYNENDLRPSKGQVFWTKTSSREKYAEDGKPKKRQEWI